MVPRNQALSRVWKRGCRNKSGMTAWVLRRSLVMPDRFRHPARRLCFGLPSLRQAGLAPHQRGKGAVALLHGFPVQRGIVIGEP